jgi:hypothetical protein
MPAPSNGWITYQHHPYFRTVLQGPAGEKVHASRRTFGGVAYDLIWRTLPGGGWAVTGRRGDEFVGQAQGRRQEDATAAFLRDNEI